MRRDEGDPTTSVAGSAWGVTDCGDADDNLLKVGHKTSLDGNQIEAKGM